MMVGVITQMQFTKTFQGVDVYVLTQATQDVKSKNTWGSWNNYPGSVDCPAAKLDEVYQVLNGKRSLRVGKVSGVKDLFASNEKFYYERGWP